MIRTIQVNFVLSVIGIAVNERWPVQLDNSNEDIRVLLY